MTYAIYDLTGRVYYKSKVTAGKPERIYLKDWPAGTYLLHTNDQNEVVSFIVRH